MDRTQATALASGDVSAFSVNVKWADLAARTTTPEPLPTGYTNRWYVSSIELGQGVDAHGAGSGALPMNYLGRVQPYAIYVPTHYDGTHAVPLTWMLHSLSEQHNQYGSLDPRFVTAACERRSSICVTTLGRGPGGWYYDEAELDFWEVWNRVATAYRLDPSRTVISGYSMGGWGTYKLGLAHPDLFSKAMPLEAAAVCGTRPLPGVPVYTAGGRCAKDGDSVPIIDSARNLPFVISQGAIDELAPLTGALPDFERFRSLGYRVRFELYPTADHLAYPVFDDFAEQATQMDGPPIVSNPAHVTYAWYPSLDRPDLGIGSTGAYWIRDTKGRDLALGAVSRVDAVSSALTTRAVSPTTTVSPLLSGDPFPGVAIDQQWVLGAASPAHPDIAVALANVASLGIDVARAGFTCCRPGRIHVTSDGATTITVLAARPGSAVGLDGGASVVVPAAGAVIVHVPAGNHVVTVSG
jgi:pimeloyl-ACP methyl ester carboxylesterase